MIWLKLSSSRIRASWLFPFIINYEALYLWTRHSTPTLFRSIACHLNARDNQCVDLYVYSKRNLNELIEARRLLRSLGHLTGDVHKIVITSGHVNFGITGTLSNNISHPDVFQSRAVLRSCYDSQYNTLCLCRHVLQEQVESLSHPHDVYVESSTLLLFHLRLGLPSDLLEDFRRKC